MRTLPVREPRSEPFAWIELIAVLAILGILAVILIPHLGVNRDQTQRFVDRDIPRDATDVAQISSAVIKPGPTGNTASRGQ